MEFINLSKKGFYKISPRIDLPMSLTEYGGLKIMDFKGDQTQIYQFEYVQSKEAYLIKRLDQTNNILKGINGVLRCIFFADGLSNSVYIGAQNGDDSEYWIPIFLNNGYVLIANLKRPDMVLTVLSYEGVNILTHYVELRPYLDVSESQKDSILQQFKITKLDLYKIGESDILGYENYLIKEPYNKVLTYTLDPNGSLVAKAYENIDNQKWKFVYSDQKKSYQIHSIKDQSLVMTFDTIQKTVKMIPNQNNLNQYWILEQVDNESYIIRSKDNPLYGLCGYSEMNIGEVNNREIKQRIVLEKL